MPVDKVLFMPFDVREQSILSAQIEYGTRGTEQKNQQTIDHELSKGKQAIEVWYNGKKNASVHAMVGGQIYIRGHGMPGQNTIEGGRGGQNVRFDDVVDRLIKTGLQRSFMGKIKCYNCHSAETIDPTGLLHHSIVETGGLPFAQLVANEFHARGYTKCTFYGYVGRIDSLPKNGSEGKHKYVRAFIKQSDGKTKMTEYGRVSESRFEFFPEPWKSKKSTFFRK